AWAYTSDFEDPIDPEVVHEGSRGAYLLAESELLREAPGDPAQGLSGFARVGTADEDVHPLTWSWGAGLVYTGAIPGRDDDRVGLAVTTAHPAPKYRQAEAVGGRLLEPREVALEATYALQLRPWLLLQPDVQYIFDPGMHPELDHALLWGLRLQVTWSGSPGGS